MTFEQWMTKVDKIIGLMTGLSVYDLPDCPFRDWYDDEFSPAQAARKALQRR